MLRKIVYVILLTSICAFANAPEIYTQIRVPWGYEDKVPSEIIYARDGVWAEFALPESELAILTARAVPYEVIIPDMQAFYASRLDSRLDMGGWRTYEMILAALDSLHDEYPEYVSEPEVLGEGWDGYLIKGIKVSQNVDIDAGKPQVLIFGAIHAREVVTPDIVLEFARWLLDSMATSEVARHIVEKREVWLIPLLNPDGYVYNQTTSPTGGGMWRKNRRNNGSSMGVDLNRNFPYEWGYDDVGSSPNPGSETYRGPSPASEPETQTIIELVNANEFRTVLDFHSFGNMYLFPWGWTLDLPDDHDWFMRVGYRFARGNGYIYGPGAGTIYPTNGGTDDWFYGERSVRPWIFPCTPEVGGNDDGFWPPLSRRPELIAENMNVCIINCQIAGSAPFITRAWIDPDFGESGGYANPGETARLLVEVENLGFDPSAAFVRAFSGTAGLTMIDDSAWGGVIPSTGYDTVGFLLDLDEATLAPGDNFTVRFEVRDTSGYVAFDSASLTCGTPIVIVSWDFEGSSGGFVGTGDWEWGIPTTGPENAFSGDRLWATKLSRNYSDNTLSELATPAIAIPDSAHRPRLELEHWFSWEAPSASSIYDGGTVKITSDGGTTWQVVSPLGGYDGVAYEHNPYIAGDSVFTASSGGWRTETFDLSPFAGTTIHVKFVAGSDPYVNSAGWYIDDVRFIYYLEREMAAGFDFAPKSLSIDVFPNPFNAACRISFGTEHYNGDVKLEIFDIAGRPVRTFDSPSVIWDGRDSAGNELPTGVYLARFTAGKNIDVRKISLIK
ncbi:MAG TPA: T9SS type A sorting domain-containing protein [candidate division Zixibacteria bacterium]|nr:T9SS type A sorting domain-containing protein [candidate division Zixibacteria bacterium]